MEKFFCFLCIDWTKSGKELGFFLEKDGAHVGWASYSAGVPAAAFFSKEEMAELIPVIKNRNLNLIGSWRKICMDGFIRPLEAPEPAGQDDGWRQIDQKWWKCPIGHTAKTQKGSVEIVCDICKKSHRL